MCEFPISKAACASVATTAIHYFDGRVSITHQNPREAFSLSPVSTGSFSELFSTLATTSLSSFSSLSRWLASRASRGSRAIQRGTILPNRVSRQLSPSVSRDTIPSGVWCTIDGGVERRRRRRRRRRQSAKPAMASTAIGLQTLE